MFQHQIPRGNNNLKNMASSVTSRKKQGARGERLGDDVL